MTFLRPDSGYQVIACKPAVTQYVIYCNTVINHSEKYPDNQLYLTGSKFVNTTGSFGFFKSLFTELPTQVFLSHSKGFILAFALFTQKAEIQGMEDILSKYKATNILKPSLIRCPTWSNTIPIFSIFFPVFSSSVSSKIRQRGFWGASFVWFFALSFCVSIKNLPAKYQSIRRQHIFSLFLSR